MRTSTWNESDFKPETALTAAALSMVPGLGQIYNGEARKGVLFFFAGAANFFFLSLICLKGFLVTGAKFIGANLHVRLNSAVMDCLNNLDMRSPQMLMLSALLLAFTIFCVRDALNRRQQIRRREIYSAEALQMSEAASGSYIVHAVMFASMFLLVLFLFVPPEAKKQITEIEFFPEQTPTTKPIKSNDKSVKSAEDAGRVKPHQVADTPRSQPSQATNSAPKSSDQPKQAEPAKAKPEEKFTSRTINQPKPEQQQSEQQKPLPRKSETKAPSKPEKAEPTPTEVRVPRPPAPPTNQPKTPMLPAPMPAINSARTASSVTPTPTIQPTRTSSNSAAGLPAPQPLLASALPSLTAAAPAPTATSNSGKSSSTPAPAPAAAHRNGSAGTAPAAPEVQRDAGQSSGSSAPQPVPSGEAPSKRSSSSGPGGSPAPRAMPAGSTGNNKIPMATPVLGPSTSSTPGGLGASPTIDNDDRAPAHRVALMPDFGSYMADLQRRIKREWYPAKDGTSRRVVVIFKILKNGELSNLRILNGSGDSHQDEAALKAVEHAAPFKHLPAGADDDVDVQFTFDYKLFTGQGGGVKF